METFNEAFTKARKEKGPNATFTWKGESYSTSRADDTKKTTPPPARPENLKGPKRTTPPPPRPANLKAPRADRDQTGSSAGKAKADTPTGKTRGTVKRAQPVASPRRPDQQRVEENRAGRMMQTARDSAAASNAASRKAAAEREKKEADRKNREKEAARLAAIRESNKPRKTPAANPIKTGLRSLGNFIRGGGAGGAQARAAADKRDAKKNSKR